MSQAPDTDTVRVALEDSTWTLSQDREVPTIPRAQPTYPSTYPSNSEQETGQGTNGDWLYLLETQLSNTMMRKAATTTSPQDLDSLILSMIPIHNAVNE